MGWRIGIDSGGTFGSVPDPRLRGRRPPMPVDELRNPLRPADFVPPPRSYAEVAPGHFVQQA